MMHRTGVPLQLALLNNPRHCLEAHRSPLVSVSLYGTYLNAAWFTLKVSDACASTGSKKKRLRYSRNIGLSTVAYTLVLPG